MNRNHRVEELVQPRETVIIPHQAPTKSSSINGPSGSAGPGSLPLFEKTRNYKSAAKVRALNLYPYFRTISSAQDTEVLIDGRNVLMLGSNSYLGLTNHPKIKEAARAAVDKYGTGCAGSRFLNGTLKIHLELEEALSHLVQKEAVLLYSTGFQVNLGVISALVAKDDFIFADKSNHASIVDGCMLSLGDFIRFPHRDMAALEQRLIKTDPEAGKLIVVDGVFSMEGDIIQLPELCRLARQHRAAVMVDDAHAIGVIGHHGARHGQPFRFDRRGAPDHGDVQQVVGESRRLYCFRSSNHRLSEAPFACADLQREYEPSQRRGGPCLPGHHDP
jgi:hypothetical protein